MRELANTDDSLDEADDSLEKTDDSPKKTDETPMTDRCYSDPIPMTK